ncbi:beta-1,4-mannosyltransferase egh-like [Pollicipes pollicipes]|uniref:beta-1,4-mannosyltransferase egh-like n=1 Tax=Pollicipes pollicipes TaxID=41117 RepID=UPI0018852694|nr:beta-1,4-mannosyltransferase egh-like [Pollicipes pollicipes]XP_037069931.1 beta-1,4-mannosyltransferase egh-like [Pollicipes pollicipes]XP_037069933.1 beta-1,4-mannosyltransferase egh-like [Pollicipes pollicipes]
MASSRLRHCLHCGLMLAFVLGFEAYSGAFRLSEFAYDEINPWVEYGYLLTVLLYMVRLLTFLALPQVLFNILGLVVYNTFPEKVVLKGSPLLAPFVCVRVVTRGDYPELVRANTLRNMNTCLAAGMENFMVEVVTDRAVHLAKHARLREVVVPSSYQTKSGALFKARALQYSLEDDVNMLQATDWVVHLDEETLLTESAVRGVLNFVMDGSHKFGQGLITYANENVVNWATTLADSFRVSDDMGKVRFQFKYFHKPLFSWKGSYVVTQLDAERKVSFDNGMDGSVAEDCYFAMMAFQEGYSFDFIEGEMWEKSPFTFWDFLQQRKRWMQGIWLVVHSRAIALRYKAMLSLSIYAWVTMPVATSNIILAYYWPLPMPQLLDILSALIGAACLYMYVFGVMKSFSLYRMGYARLLLCIVGALCTVPLNVTIENVAVIWGLFGSKHHFYVVNKVVKGSRHEAHTV